MKEEELIARASSGDSLAMEELLTAYMGMVKAVARQYYIVGATYEDVSQEGMIGLYKAVVTYKREKGRFSAYAYACIKAAVIDAVKAASREKNKALNTSVPLENTVGLVSDVDITVNLVGGELMARIKSRLSPAEEEIFSMWAEGMSYAEIAKELGKTVKNVDNAVQRIKKKAKAVIKEG